MADDITERASKGGKARAALLSPEERQKIAIAAAEARWGTSLPTAKYGSPDKPLRIGGIEIQCYVLDDDRRVLVQRGLQSGIGMSTSGGTGGAHRMARFVASLEAKGVDTNELSVRMSDPILFRPQGFGKPAYGYEATILTEVCDAVLEARNRGILHPSQEPYAKQCEILVRGLAQVGIIALVDEATGFQKERARDALAKILEAFVQKELRRWVRTFPAQFYEQLYRLRGLKFPPTRMQMPPYFGHLTNNIVYDRLAPGVKEELKRVTPRDSKGKHKQKLFQRLTEDVGHPHLQEHLAAVTAIMKLSPDGNYDHFERNLDKALPKWDDTLPLPLG